MEYPPFANRSVRAPEMTRPASVPQPQDSRHTTRRTRGCNCLIAPAKIRSHACHAVSAGPADNMARPHEERAAIGAKAIGRTGWHPVSIGCLKPVHDLKKTPCWGAQQGVLVARRRKMYRLYGRHPDTPCGAQFSVSPEPSLPRRNPLLPSRCLRPPPGARKPPPRHQRLSPGCQRRCWDPSRRADPTGSLP